MLVDDVQEANPAVFELLADIAAGKDAIITFSPDTVVQGFRGARPDLVADLPRLLAPAGGAVLNVRFGSPTGTRPPWREAWLSVAGRISHRAGGSPRGGSSSPHRGRRPRSPATAVVDPTPLPGTVEAHLLPSPVHELRYVAQRILEPS